MKKRKYWLDLFTGNTWIEFKEAGGKVSGFRPSRWMAVQKIKKGDYFLCYVTGISRFIGILEVVSEPYKDFSPIWSNEDFPCRLKVKPVIELTFETAVPVHDLKDSLPLFKNLKNSTAWTGAFRRSPAKWSSADGDVVVKALEKTKENPVERPYDKKQLKYRPRDVMMFDPHEGILNLTYSFEEAYIWIEKESKISFYTSNKTLFTALAANVRRGPRIGEKVIRIFQNKNEYARAYRCCWGHYYNCNRTRIGMYCKAIDTALTKHLRGKDGKTQK